MSPYFKVLLVLLILLLLLKFKGKINLIRE